MSDRLCIVMPVYNEREVISSVLEKWDAALKSLGIDYEIRPYNDGSRDGSLEVMLQTAQKLGPCVNVRDKPNGGHGNTILTGYREAAVDGFDWIFQIDSDDEMGPEKFGELWSRRTDHDFLVGTRDGRRQALPRKLVSFVSRLCVRIFYGKSIWDVNTPYRLMRVSAFKDFYSRIPPTTFAPNVILSGLAARHGLRCFETGVSQHDRTTGEVSIRKWKLFKAAVRSFWQTMVYSLDSRRGWYVFGCLCAISTLMKFVFSTKGWNFDFESYKIVAEIVNSGGNVYAETGRYNYGPIWFNILGLLRKMMGDGFRYGIIAVLCMADIGIATLLWRRKLFTATFIFLLSIISMHVSGYHNQFDNIAILTAFASVLLIGKAEKGTGFVYWAGIIMLGGRKYNN